MNVAAISRPGPPGHAAAQGVSTAARLRRVLSSGLGLGLAVATGLAIWIVVVLGGLQYYTTPLAVRAYEPAHRVLRPSGDAGLIFGAVGTAMMLVPFLYMLRKRLGGAKGPGTLRTWLEIHLFCGIVGPVLITFHTSFKFNGLISAAYWSMVMVVLSGFVGRYLYIRIPRSIRGAEMSQAELDSRAEDLKDGLAQWVGSEGVVAHIERFERAVVPTEADLSFLDLCFGDITLRRRLRAFDDELASAGLTEMQRAEIIGLTAERSFLLRRTAYLRLTKRLFNLWHVFHLPLVYLLLVVAAAHITVALYLGYVPLFW